MSTSTLRDYFIEIGRAPLLSAEEENALARRYKEHGDTSARDKLIMSNLRLVAFVAKNYKNDQLTLEDLIQEGSIGLFKAVEKYDPDMSTRFSTCAVPRIKQAITKAITDKGRAVRNPAHVYQSIAKYRQAVSDCINEGLEATDENVAKIMGVEAENVRKLRIYKQNTISLDIPLGEDGEDTLSDLQADRDDESPTEYTEKVELQEKLRKLIHELKPRTQTIIKMKFGIWEEGDPEEFKNTSTLEDIGAYLNLTRERVRQILNEALSQMRLRLDK